MHNHLLHGLFDPKILFQTFLVGGGELSHSDEQRTGSVGTGKPFQSGLHHAGGTCGVEVGDIHTQGGKHLHGLLNGVGDIVELKIQEDLMSATLDLANDLGTLCVVQLHADLYERLLFLELIQECKNIFFACEVASHDHVFTHDALLL